MGRMHGNVYKALPNAELVACVDIKPDVAASYAKDFGCKPYADLEAVVREVDVVDVCVPTYLHKEFTLKAAQAGRHVFCEKPMALRVEDADEMIAACERAGVTLMVGHCIRFWPEYALLKRIVQERAMGRLLSFNLTRYGAFPTWSSDNWMACEDKAGGGALDMHIHDTDYALYLCGKPEKMVSFGTHDEKGVGQVFTTMRFAGDVVGHTEGGWNLPSATPFKMAFRAIFEKGAAIMDGGPMALYMEGRDPETPEFPKMEAAGGGNISDLGGYFLELEYFLNCLETGRKPEIVTPESSRESLVTTLEEIRMAKGL